jgi:uncharacterized protein YndB with AHSA1/START domain
MSKPEFVYVTYIATTPEKLWKALTSPAFTAQYWFGMRLESASDWRVGSKFEALRSDGTPGDAGEVLECDPPRRLSLTYRPGDERVRHEAPSRVTYELERVGTEVRLTVTHDRFEEGSQLFEGVRVFWPQLLSSLKSFLETGRALAVTSADAPRH